MTAVWLRLLSRYVLVEPVPCPVVPLTSVLHLPYETGCGKFYIWDSCGIANISESSLNRVMDHFSATFTKPVGVISINHSKELEITINRVHARSDWSGIVSIWVSNWHSYLESSTYLRQPIPSLPKCLQCISNLPQVESTQLTQIESILLLLVES